MAGRNAWPFFLFQLDWPEVGSELEPEKSYGSPWMIGICLTCVCRTLSSCWSSVSLASSSAILELACTNFSSVFWQWSHSMEALFSAILMSWVRLSWRSLYHSTSYSTQRMLHPLYGKQCLAMWFGRPSQPPCMVFLPLVPLTLLLQAKSMLCTYHIPHDVLWW